MSGADSAALELMSLLPRTGRGPRREGVYAVWLMLRVAQDMLLDPPLPERALRRRLAALEHRLSSLTVPPPLRRALHAAQLQLRDDGAPAVGLVLTTLVAPVRESIGAEAGDAIQRAGRAARQATASSR
ncbi:MAG: hypothetical protein ABI587_08670 [Gemmatimonadales bacterium]